MSEQQRKKIQPSGQDQYEKDIAELREWRKQWERPDVEKAGEGARKRLDEAYEMRKSLKKNFLRQPGINRPETMGAWISQLISDEA